MDVIRPYLVQLKGVMELLDSLIRLAQHTFGEELSHPEILKGDGSDRQIYRFRRGEESWIGVTNPNIAENQAFIFLSGHLAQCGIPVPEIYISDVEQTCYLLEDLGHLSFADCLGQWSRTEPVDTTAILNAYQKVLYWLPRIQFEGDQGLDYTFCFRDHELDRSVFQWDVTYFKQSFWKLFASHYPFDDAVDQDLEALIQYVGNVERQVLVVRDFQPRNIMWREGEPYFIDYQMGCRGAIHYDIATLLYAFTSGLDDQLRESLIDTYLRELRPWLPLSPVQFLNDFYHFVLIRRLRSLGTYGFLASQRGKPHFLKAVPRTIQEIDDLLDHRHALSSLSHLKALFSQWKQDERLSQVSALYHQLGLPDLPHFS